MSFHITCAMKKNLVLSKKKCEEVFPGDIVPIFCKEHSVKAAADWEMISAKIIKRRRSIHPEVRKFNQAQQIEGIFETIVSPVNNESKNSLPLKNDHSNCNNTLACNEMQTNNKVTSNSTQPQILPVEYNKDTLMQDTLINTTTTCDTTTHRDINTSNETLLMDKEDSVMKDVVSNV